MQQEPATVLIVSVAAGAVGIFLGVVSTDEIVGKGELRERLGRQ